MKPEIWLWLIDLIGLIERNNMVRPKYQDDYIFYKFHLNETNLNQHILPAIIAIANRKFCSNNWYSRFNYLRRR